MAGILLGMGPASDSQEGWLALLARCVGWDEEGSGEAKVESRREIRQRNDCMSEQCHTIAMAKGFLCTGHPIPYMLRTLQAFHRLGGQNTGEEGESPTFFSRSEMLFTLC